MHGSKLRRKPLLDLFANGVEKDRAAVRNAIISPWSNGQTEGQITRLKLIKRQMYGRAKIDLLQARLREKSDLPVPPLHPIFQPIPPLLRAA